MIPTLLLVLIRGAVASLFLLYGVEKMQDRAAFRRVLQRYLSGRWPRLTAVGATVLPVLEITLGGLFLFGVASPLVGSALALLLLLFTAVLLQEWLRHSGASDCGCAKAPMPVRRATLRNLVLLAATLSVVLLPGGQAPLAFAWLEAALGLLIVAGGILTRQRLQAAPAAPTAPTAAKQQETTVGQTDRLPEPGRRAFGKLALKGGLLLAVASVAAWSLTLATNGVALAKLCACETCAIVYEKVCNCGSYALYECYDINCNGECLMPDCAYDCVFVAYTGPAC